MKYDCGGTITPPAPISGSAMKAATVSGSSALDAPVEVVGQAPGEGVVALVIAGEPIA